MVDCYNLYMTGLFENNKPCIYLFERCCFISVLTVGSIVVGKKYKLIQVRGLYTGIYHILSLPVILYLTLFTSFYQNG